MDGVVCEAGQRVDCLIELHFGFIRSGRFSQAEDGIDDFLKIAWRRKPARLCDFAFGRHRLVVLLVSGKGSAYFYVAKARWRCTVARPHRLHRLALAAIWSAPQRPEFFA